MTEVKKYKVTGVVQGVIMECSPEEAIEAFRSAFMTHNIPHFVNMIDTTNIAAEEMDDSVPADVIQSAKDLFG